MLYFALISCAASIIAIIAMVFGKRKSNPVAFVGSIVGIISGFIALAISAPRDFEHHDFDYLGIIVAILAVFATLLLTMQLYQIFRLKEDAEYVKNAKEVIEGYAKKVKFLEEKMDGLGKYVDNPEWIYAITDAKDHFLFGIKRDDGAIEWSAGVPEPIKNELDALKERLMKLEHPSEKNDK